MESTESAPISSIAGDPNTPPTTAGLSDLEIIGRELKRLYPGGGRPRPETIQAARYARLNRGRGLEERRVGMIAAMVVGRDKPYAPDELSRIEIVLAKAESRGLKAPPSIAPMDRATARRIQVARDALRKAEDDQIRCLTEENTPEARWRVWIEEQPAVEELEAQFAEALSGEPGLASVEVIEPQRRVGLKSATGPRCVSCNAFLSRYGQGGERCWWCWALQTGEWKTLGDLGPLDFNACVSMMHRNGVPKQTREIRVRERAWRGENWHWPARRAPKAAAATTIRSIAQELNTKAVDAASTVSQPDLVADCVASIGRSVAAIEDYVQRPRAA